MAEKQKKAVKKPPELKVDDEYLLSRDKESEEKEEHYIKLRLGDDIRRRIADIIMKEVNNAPANQERKAFIDHMGYCRKRYTMEDLETEFPWEGASRRRTGGCTIATDRLIPRMKKAIYYSGHITSVTPEGENTEENAKLQEKWLDDVIRNDMKLEENTENVLFDAVMLNFGVIKLPWVSEEEKKEEVTVYESAEELMRNYPDILETYPQFILKLTGYDTMEDLLLDYPGMENLPRAGVKLALREKFWDRFNGLRPEWVDPEDIIFPQGTTDADDSWIVIQKLKMRRDELLRKQKAGFFENVNDLFPIEASQATSDDDLGREYDIYEAILNYDIDGDGLEEKCVYWIAKGRGGNVWLRGIRYPYHHNKNYFIVHRVERHRYGFYTGGLGAKLRPVSASEDKRVNQISNAWDQAIVKAWTHVRTPNSPYDPRIHKYYPGATIPIGQPGELTEMRTSDIPGSSLTLLEDNRREAELLHGVSVALLSGQVTPQDPRAPAKKSELLIAESNVAISEYLKNYVRGLKNLIEQTQMNYYQFTDTTEVNFGRPDKGYETISRQQMRARAGFTFKSAIESIVAVEKARSYAAFMEMMAGNPIMSQNLSGMAYITRLIIENWDEEMARNIDRIMPPGIELLIQKQVEEAAQLAEQQKQQEEQEKQVEEYRKQRKREGASSEEIEAEIQQMMGGGGQAPAVGEEEIPEEEAGLIPEEEGAVL